MNINLGLSNIGNLNALVDKYYAENPDIAASAGVTMPAPAPVVSARLS